jgi:hypothetical protein
VLTSIGLYADYGLTPDLSVQLVAGLERSHLGPRAMDGVGPCSAGVRYVLARRPGGFLSAYVGATTPAADEGVRPDPAAGQAGGDLRLLAGQSRRVLGHDLFAEVQVARLFASGDGSQTRIDLTLGIQFGPRLMQLNQIYAGQQEGVSLAASWVKLDHRLVRSVGAWRVQIGWR